MRDAKDFYAHNLKKDDGPKEEEKSPSKVKKELGTPAKHKKKKTSQEKRQDKEEQDKKDRQRKLDIEEDFKSLWENTKNFDPYKDINLEKCDGKI